jgi:hypothetical protein
MRDVSTTGGYVPFSILKYGDTVYNNKKTRESLRNLLPVVNQLVMLAVIMKQMQNLYIIRVLANYTLSILDARVWCFHSFRPFRNKRLYFSRMELEKDAKEIWGRGN